MLPPRPLPMASGRDLEDLVAQVADELARRVESGGAARPLTGEIGAGPWCGLCDKVGTCANTCPERVDGIVAAGATRVEGRPGLGQVDSQTAGLIDHTLLKPDATRDQVRTLCAEAAKFQFASVCVNPFWVPYCVGLLADQNVPVCTVVGFPLGASSSATKAQAAAEAVAAGAGEIDMVLNVGALKSGMADVVASDIRAVREAIGANVVLKVILETCYLDDREKISACEIAKAAGANFVKTSTGFGSGGATAPDIALMRRVVGPAMGVKASGGIRDRDTADVMVRMGATRIGASASVKIVDRLPSLDGQASGSAGGKASQGGY